MTQIQNEDIEFDKELKLLLNKLKKNDTVVVVSLLTLGKKRHDLENVINTIIKREACLISLEEKINTNDNYNFYEILRIINFIDKKINGDKIKSKLNILKKSGKKLGRPSIEEKTIKKIRYLRYEEKLTLREISIQCELSIGTIYKYIQ